MTYQIDISMLVSLDTDLAGLWVKKFHLYVKDVKIGFVLATDAHRNHRQYLTGLPGSTGLLEGRSKARFPRPSLTHRQERNAMM